MRTDGKLIYDYREQMNPASELAKKRWAKLTPKQKAAALKKLRKARNENMTDAEKSESARKAAKARWAKYRKDKDLRKSGKSS